MTRSKAFEAALLSLLGIYIFYLFKKKSIVCFRKKYESTSIGYAWTVGELDSVKTFNSPHCLLIGGTQRCASYYKYSGQEWQTSTRCFILLPGQGNLYHSFPQVGIKPTTIMYAITRCAAAPRWPQTFSWHNIFSQVWVNISITS